MKKLFNILAISSLILLTACSKDDDIKVITPGDFLPAYPLSYWDYSDGSRILTSSNYVHHSYHASTSSKNETQECLVPIWDGKYLYKYSVYQQSTTMPLRKLLNATGSNAWVVEENNGVTVKRTETHLDSLTISWKNNTDTTFKDVYMVTEHLGHFDYKTKWNIREYYAKYVGLIRVEVNNPYQDVATPVIQKDLRSYSIKFPENN